jgi:hypothetical protein
VLLAESQRFFINQLLPLFGMESIVTKNSFSSGYVPLAESAPVVHVHHPAGCDGGFEEGDFSHEIRSDKFGSLAFLFSCFYKAPLRFLSPIEYYGNQKYKTTMYSLRIFIFGVVFGSLGFSVSAQNATPAQEGNSQSRSALEWVGTPATPQPIAAPAPPTADELSQPQVRHTAKPVYKDTGDHKQDGADYVAALQRWVDENRSEGSAESAKEANRPAWSSDNVVYPDSVDTSSFSAEQRKANESGKSPKDFPASNK